MFQWPGKTLFRTNGILIFGIVAVTAFCGCKTTSPDRTRRPTSTKSLVAATDSIPRKVFKKPAKSKPTTKQKLNPIFWFGNMDDPVPPDWYRPNHRMRRILWSFRNPLHNFVFYVIGIADKEFEIVGRYPGEIFNPNGGWNWTVCKYKCLRLPMISYKRGNFNFYLGWRPSGNFGLKLNYSD